MKPAMISDVSRLTMAREEAAGSHAISPRESTPPPNW